jgi:hypothetical protein
MPFLDDVALLADFWLWDFQTQIMPNETQRNTLMVAGVYIILIAILWCVYLILATLGAEPYKLCAGVFLISSSSVNSFSFVVKMLVLNG